MENRIVIKIVGTVIVTLGLVALISQHPVTVIVIAIGVGLYYIGDKIL